MDRQNLKLIAVFNSFHLELYVANHEKVMQGPEIVPLVFEKHNRQENHQSLRHSSGSSATSSISGSFEPHTDPKDLEHQDAAKMIAAFIEKKLRDKTEYKEFIAIGDPKTLGCFRQSVGHHTGEIMTKSIAKNLVGKDAKTVEHAVFLLP
ncbi:MAG: host attachment protein [Pseudomonadota bacterium]